jgi:hypothetical protein
MRARNPTSTDHRHHSAASLPSDLRAIGAAKQGKKQSKTTQITQIKSKITPMSMTLRARTFKAARSAFNSFPCNL